MQESLGISISNQVIKYAKVTKNNNQLSVASCGIKFYDDLTKNISQIKKPIWGTFIIFQYVNAYPALPL